ncbi:ABC transporter ATP-binding protein [Brevibacterium album]|uniref:ABC transporter ATP-binding protein n=1 Tax=Brevibacterium album TaxID=417948 RepID=UPI0004005C62|nr:ABC transporter ATP-binding protein [Brevibacterium album]
MRILLRFWPDIRPRAGRYLVSILLALASTGVSLLIPVLTGRAVDGPIAERSLTGLAVLTGLVVLVGTAEAVLQLVRRLLTAGMTADWEVQWRHRLYRHLQRLDAARHDEWDSGQMLSRATNDLSQLRRFFAFGFPFLVITPVVVVLGGIVLAFIEPVFALVLVLMAIPTMAGVAWFNARYKLASRAAQDAMGEVSTSVEESVQGIRVLLSFGRSPWAAQRFRGIVERLRGHELRKVRLDAWLFGVVMLLPQLAQAAIAGLGAWGVVAGWATLGEVVAAVTLMMYLRMPIEMFGFLLSDALMSLTAAARYWELMDIEPRIVSPGSAREQNPEPGGSDEGVIEFDRVGFVHEDAELPVLDGISLRVEAGETLALVGTTGGGKTTLAALVPRLFDATAGSVRVDGTDVREQPLARLRSRVGVAFEEPILFSATVRENVLMGAQSAERASAGDAAGPVEGAAPPEGAGEAAALGDAAALTDARIWEALEVAQAADFVAELPDRLETQVGEQGLALSGGQRQRIALARAVAGRPQFLVLDDPLSAVDVDTEDRVQQRLREALSHTTALIVAHRPSTAALADRVAVLEDGRIAAVGGHEELLATSAAYRELMGAHA